MGLVDYNKAFDSVKIPDVIDALNEQGIEPVYVNVLQHIYRYAKSYIRLHKDGVRQDDISSPKLFIACLEKVFRKQRWEKKGIKIDGEYISHLQFADDIIIFANRIEVGLSMKLKKTTSSLRT